MHERAPHQMRGNPYDARTSDKEARQVEGLIEAYGREWEIHPDVIAATRRRMPTEQDLARGLVYGLLAPTLEELAVKLAAQRLLH